MAKLQIINVVDLSEDGEDEDDKIITALNWEIFEKFVKVGDESTESTVEPVVRPSGLLLIVILFLFFVST